MNHSLNKPIKFTSGATMKNRFMLAPMTNTQSHKDGTLSNDEFKWLTMRAEGQFGLVMTCASHVQEIGKGFPGQLGIFSDKHISGHTRLAKAIQDQGSLAVIQLHHAGMRSPTELIGESPVCPSDMPKYGARALNTNEVHQLRDDFIHAAKRAKQAGYDGVEIHGAHGYIVAQFLSADLNRRTDQYGGSFENRCRLLHEIIAGVRNQCGADFLLGVRLSPEKFGMKLSEIKSIVEEIIAGEKVDFLDISLWDCFKMPEEVEHQDKSLLQHFTDIDFKQVKFTVAGKIRDGAEVSKILEAGVDFVTIGRSAILHYNFPELVMKNPNFKSKQLPVSEAYLKTQGLGSAFIEYMRRWPDFVE